MLRICTTSDLPPSVAANSGSSRWRHRGTQSAELATARRPTCCGSKLGFRKQLSRSCRLRFCTKTERPQSLAVNSGSCRWRHRGTQSAEPATARKPLCCGSKMGFGSLLLQSSVTWAQLIPAALRLSGSPAKAPEMAEHGPLDCWRRPPPHRTRNGRLAWKRLLRNRSQWASRLAAGLVIQEGRTRCSSAIHPLQNGLADRRQHA